MNKIILAVSILVLAMLACGQYTTPEPIAIANTLTASPMVLPTSSATPVVIANTSTPTATLVTNTLCVTASEAVYLRTQPDMAHDAILPLPNGAKVTDTGTRSGTWYFVEYQDKKGWVNSAYLSECQ
jgi:uncharacterized protein YgiM (DUF1202 family)